ncbi:MAG: putative transcriptional regulator [Methylophagaceae bacterium]|jgi:putative transcriptional regulator
MDNISTSLKNNFLIAMPSLNDAFFYQSVIYLCEHSNQGAMGLIINRPSKIMLSELLDHIDIPHHGPSNSTIPVLLGGPVAQNQGMVLHDSANNIETSVPISDSVFLNGSSDILRTLANQTDPSNLLVTLGYASWSAGQLEQEIANNDWLNVEADNDILFHSSGQSSWQQAASLLGVDIQLISGSIGHA